MKRDVSDHLVKWCQQQVPAAAAAAAAAAVAGAAAEAAAASHFVTRMRNVTRKVNIILKNAKNAVDNLIKLKIK